jgi:hypothetical protein
MPRFELEATVQGLVCRLVRRRCWHWRKLAWILGVVGDFRVLERVGCSLDSGELVPGLVQARKVAGRLGVGL